MFSVLCQDMLKITISNSIQFSISIPASAGKQQSSCFSIITFQFHYVYINIPNSLLRISFPLQDRERRLSLHKFLARTLSTVLKKRIDGSVFWSWPIGSMRSSRALLCQIQLNGSQAYVFAPQNSAASTFRILVICRFNYFRHPIKQPVHLVWELSFCSVRLPSDDDCGSILERPYLMTQHSRKLASISIKTHLPAQAYNINQLFRSLTRHQIPDGTVAFTYTTTSLRWLHSQANTQNS